MKLIQTDPSFIYIEDFDDDDLINLNRVLSYQDLSAKYQYTQARQNKWAYIKNPEWHKYVLSLKGKIVKTALLEDEQGVKTYSGLIEYLRNNDVQFEYENKVDYPKFKSLPYDLNYQPLPLWDHQKQAVEALLSVKHGCIESPTGSGKAFIIENLIKHTGYSTLVVVPTVNLADSMYDQFIKAFGRKFVGFFGKNISECEKRITVGVAAGIAKLTEKSEKYNILASKDMIIFDEAHVFASNNLQKVALSVGKNIPVRYSVSATPERGDGQNVLLEGIIGNKVFYTDFQSLVDKGVLAALDFHIYQVESDASYSGKNSKKNSQEHCLYNSRILALAAKIANSRVVDANEPTVVLLEEKEQLDYLRPYLTTNFEFVHSGSDVSQQIKDFNDNKYNLIIGTSAISVGTDIKRVKNIILLFSGKSTVKFKQAIGRGTRIAPGKTKCRVFDFHVINDHQSSKHFYQRLSIYQSMSDNIIVKDA